MNYVAPSSHADGRDLVGRGGVPAMAGIGGVPAFPGGGALGGEQQFTISHLWMTIQRWRWVILGAAVAGLAIAIIVSLLTTPMYRANVTLEVNREPTQIIQVGNVQPAAVNDDDYIDTQIGVLRSHSLAQRVARQLNLANNPSFVDQSAPLAAREAAATGKVAGSFVAEPVRTSRLVTLSFSSPNPEIAAKVANGYAEGFIASNLERRFETTAYARDFLQRRIAAVKGKLEQSERQLVEYARAQGIVDLPSGGQTGGGGSLDTSSLVALNDALSKAQVDRIEAEQRLRLARSASASAAAVTNPAVQSLRVELAKLESQYQENLNVFKPDFPAMVRLREQIAALRKNVAEESSSLSGSVSSTFEAD